MELKGRCQVDAVNCQILPPRDASRRFVVVINLAYDDQGTGEPVLFIAGRGGVGRTWHLYQVPAFLAAGYRVITFDNRGVGATANADGFTTRDAWSPTPRR